MNSIEFKIQCAGNLLDVSFSITTTIVLHVRFSSITQVIAQAFHVWSEFKLRIGTTQLNSISFHHMGSSSPINKERSAQGDDSDF